MKKHISFVLVLLIVVGNITFAHALDSAPDISTVEFVSTSEYEMFQNDLDELRKTDAVRAKQLQKEYIQRFNQRASLPVETLLNFGYTEEQIKTLKEYSAGNISFESAASLTSAVLNTFMSAPTHTTSQYSFYYSWTWTSVPVNLYEDGVGLVAMGINPQSQNFDVKIDAKNSIITYYYTTGSYYGQENATISTSNAAVNSTFDLYKQNSLGTEYVWAKSGNITMTVSPTVEGGATFAAARARGEYGHATSHVSGLNISGVVTLLYGLLDVAFSFSGGSLSEMGLIQRVYYNNGTYITES